MSSGVIRTYPGFFLNFNISSMRNGQLDWVVGRGDGSNGYDTIENGYTLKRLWMWGNVVSAGAGTFACNVYKNGIAGGNIVMTASWSLAGTGWKGSKDDTAVHYTSDDDLWVTVGVSSGTWQVTNVNVQLEGVWD